MNPRSQRPVGYAFVDLATPEEATAAIKDLSGHEILNRKVSVQQARKPDQEGNTGKKAGGRGRFRGRSGRRVGGRSRHPKKEEGEEDKNEETAAGDEQKLEPEQGKENPLTDVTGKHNGAPKRRGRAPKQRGPPEDGTPSKTKVMVANIPYDMNNDKASFITNSSILWGSPF